MEEMWREVGARVAKLVDSGRSTRQGPAALNFATRSRTICNMPPPIRAGRLGPARAIIDRCQHEQASGLCAVPRAASRLPHIGGVEICAKRDRHGKLQSACLLESAPPPDRNPREARSLILGMRLVGCRYAIMEIFALIGNVRRPFLGRKNRAFVQTAPAHFCPQQCHQHLRIRPFSIRPSRILRPSSMMLTAPEINSIT